MAELFPKAVRFYEVKGVKARIREDTSDEFIVDEVIRGNTYRKLNIRSTETVLDVGLNIGMFTIYALKKGAARVYSYEAERENYEAACYNVKLNCGGMDYKLTNAAVVGNDDVTRLFSINLKRNKGAHSLVAKRGRESVSVDCQNFNDILQSIQPTVIKMDIEGGEYELIRSAENFSSVREFILEFHHAHLNDIPTRSKYREITSILKKHFDIVDYRPETKKAWVSLIHCQNTTHTRGE